MYVDANLIPETTDQEGLTGPAILCVDNDPCILDGLRRQLRKKFRVHIAIGGLRALETIAESGPFGVVVSELQMPGMDGIEFLTKVRLAWPETVRIMLTGRADISTAMAAINQANIFRFLVKPCAAVVIEKVLEAAVEQHRLLIAARQLTHETVLACVGVLVEVLRQVQPDALSRGMRVRWHVLEIAAEMGIKDTWELEAAATLSQIGWITLDSSIQAKAAVNEPMSEEDQARFFAHASAAARILEKIPRLGQVATLIERQHIAPKDLPNAPAWSVGDPNCVAAEVLRAASDFELLHQKGMRHGEVVSRMCSDTGVYMPEILAAMTAVAKRVAASEVKFVTVGTLAPGQILEESLLGHNGRLLLGKGEDLTEEFIARLRSLGLPPGQKVRVRSIGLKPI